MKLYGVELTSGEEAVYNTLRRQLGVVDAAHTETLNVVVDPTFEQQPVPNSLLWTPYSDAVAPSPVTGTGNATWARDVLTRDSAAPITGTSSLKDTLPAEAWKQLQTSVVNSGTSSVYSIISDGNSGFYIGGSFALVGDVVASNVAHWDGTAWTAVGTGGTATSGTVFCLALVGTTLYAGGALTAIGGVSVKYLAKWNGSAWSDLGTTTSFSVGMLSIYAIAAIGTTLYVAGQNSAYGVVFGKIVSTTWTSLLKCGAPANYIVNSLAVLGTDIYLGGEFDAIYTTADVLVTGTRYVAKWDTVGAAASPLSAGVNDVVSALKTVGSKVVIGGKFTGQWAGANPLYTRIIRWNGSAFESINDGQEATGITRPVTAIGVGPAGELLIGNSGGGAGSQIQSKASDTAPWVKILDPLTNDVKAFFVSGLLTYIGGKFPRLGSNVGCLGTLQSGIFSGLTAFPLNDGRGPRFTYTENGYIYFLGSVFSIGTVLSNGMIRWNGSTWESCGGLPDGSIVKKIIKDPATSTKYVLWSEPSGIYTQDKVGSWDGVAATITVLGALNPPDLKVINDITFIGTTLLAGGTFTTINSTSTGRLAKLVGSTWSAAGSPNSTVTFLHNDGSYIYAAGPFTNIGGSAISNFARSLDGTTWSILGAGVTNSVTCAVTIGTSTYFGGSFTATGVASYVAKWSGTAWSALGSGLNGNVNQLLTNGFNEVIAVGAFTQSGADAISFIGVWNGAGWTELGHGSAISAVVALVTARYGLVMSGAFTSAGGNPNLSYFVQLLDPRGSGFSYDAVLPLSALGSICKLSFSYKTDANYVTGDMGVFIYNVDTATYVSLGSYLLAKAVAATTVTLQFVPVNSVNQNYRVIIANQTRTATGRSISLDNVYFGRDSLFVSTSALVGTIPTTQISGMTGFLQPFAGLAAAVPAGWLLCNGAAVSRTTYATLFATIGLLWGIGDGSTTFNLPDLRESVPVGADAWVTTTGTTHGAIADHDLFTVGQFKDDQFQTHQHSKTTSQAGSATTKVQIGGVNTTNDTFFTEGTTNRNGTTTRGKSVGVTYIIKT